MSLRGQVERLASREVSSRELIEQALQSIEATQPTLNAFACLRADAALSEADEADRRLAAAERAPLLGVPLAVKDDTDVAGSPTAFGCAGTFASKTRDSEVVRRLRQAGAVIVGKTTTPELGQWPLTEGWFGATRNPWSLDHTPGGSSGGSASAVAAGVVAAAMGSDGLGSIRIPAAWTHLVGIKPQRGRISTWPYVDAFYGLAVVGPLARTVEDAALLLDAGAGNHAADRDRPPPPVEAFAAAARRADPGRRLRIAISFKFPYTPVPVRVDPAVRAAVERLGESLAGLGHEVEHADPFYGLVGAGVLPRAIAGLHPWMGAVPERSGLDARTKGAARLARLLLPVAEASRMFELPARRQVGRIFNRFDVLITPTAARGPFPVGAMEGLSSWESDRLEAAWCPYAWPWNVLGWPGVNVPAGLIPAEPTPSSNGGRPQPAAEVPIGAQLLGPANSEPLLIALAAQLEQVERWDERWPPVTARPLDAAQT